jgi:lipid-binding SYLF domain-containing protein
MGTRLTTGLVCLLLVGAGCSTAPKTEESRDVLSAEVTEAIAVIKQRDPGMEEFFENSYAYAVFPKVVKGAWIVGGAGGKGQVFAEDKLVGYSNVSQATIGFSFGGQYFREVIFFREKRDLARFSSGEFTFSAQVSGVAITAGAAGKADYKDGMAVFVMADKGLMIDASLGGQKFNYVPAEMIE